MASTSSDSQPQQRSGGPSVRQRLQQMNISGSVPISTTGQESQSHPQQQQQQQQIQSQQQQQQQKQRKGQQPKQARKQDQRPQLQRRWSGCILR